MEPALVVAVLWMLFGGTHIGLATRRVRAALVARLGEGGFTALFSAVASVSFAAAIAYYAAHRSEGAPGLALAHVAVFRWTLMALTVTGIDANSGGSLSVPPGRSARRAGSSASPVTRSSWASRSSRWHTPSSRPAWSGRSGSAAWRSSRSPAPATRMRSSLRAAANRTRTIWRRPQRCRSPRSSPGGSASSGASSRSVRSPRVSGSQQRSAPCTSPSSRTAAPG